MTRVASTLTPLFPSKHVPLYIHTHPHPTPSLCCLTVGASATPDPQLQTGQDHMSLSVTALDHMELITQTKDLGTTNSTDSEIAHRAPLLNPFTVYLSLSASCSSADDSSRILEAEVLESLL